MIFPALNLSRVQTHEKKLKLLFPGGAVAPPDPPFMSAYRPPGLLAGWLACWLAGLLACWLAGLLAGWLAGWLACLLACWLASWLAGLLACWLAGLLACWLAGLLACLLAGLLAFWDTSNPKNKFKLFFEILCGKSQEMCAQNRGLGVLTLCRHFQEMSAQSRQISHFGKMQFPNLDFSRLCADISRKCLHRVEGRGGQLQNSTKSRLLVLKMHQSNFEPVTFDHSRILNTVMTWSTFWRGSQVWIY
jgi:hypothetical protein